MINQYVVQSKIEAHGPPPSDPATQIGWYQENLREALRVASHTKFVIPKRQQTTDSSSMVATTPHVPASLFNTPDAMMHQDSSTLPTQLPIMDPQMSNMRISPQALFQDGQQQRAEILRELPGVASSSSPSNMAWDSSQAVGPSYAYDSSQTYNIVNTQQVYNDQQRYNPFPTQNFNENTMWPPEPTIGQNHSDIDWSQLHPERRQ